MDDVLDQLDWRPMATAPKDRVIEVRLTAQRGWRSTHSINLIAEWSETEQCWTNYFDGSLLRSAAGWLPRAGTDVPGYTDADIEAWLPIELAPRDGSRIEVYDLDVNRHVDVVWRDGEWWSFTTTPRRVKPFKGWRPVMGMA